MERDDFVRLEFWEGLSWVFQFGGYIVQGVIYLGGYFVGFSEDGGFYFIGR